MSQLQNDPIRVVPKRALILGLVTTVLFIIISLFLDWPIIKILGGFWIGLLANLITFRLIVIGTKNFLDRKEKGMKASMVPNLVSRMVVLVAALLGSFQLGTHAFFAALVGVSMVRVAIQLDGFFTIGYERSKNSQSK